MRENVGRTDRIVRGVAGPALMLVGYTRLGGRSGRWQGLLSLMAGATLLESAVTRVCPLNTVFGRDSRSPDEVARDRRERLA